MPWHSCDVTVTSVLLFLSGLNITVGQNLFLGITNITQAVELWYKKEVDGFTYGEKDYSTGHYTQVSVYVRGGGCIYYYSNLTLPQPFRPITAQLSIKAVLPLA